MHEYGRNASKNEDVSYVAFLSAEALASSRKNSQSGSPGRGGAARRRTFSSAFEVSRPASLSVGNSPRLWSTPEGFNVQGVAWPCLSLGETGRLGRAGVNAAADTLQLPRSPLSHLNLGLCPFQRMALGQQFLDCQEFPVQGFSLPRLLLRRARCHS